MKVHLHKNFKKAYDKLPKKTQEQLNQRLVIFLSDPHNGVLNNHALGGKYRGCRSINVSGDLRAVYVAGTDAVTFIKLGTHSELYD